MPLQHVVLILLVLSFLLSACNLGGEDPLAGGFPMPTPFEWPTPAATQLATRPVFNPGELVDYIAQTGDTLPALAVRFNTSVPDILTANDFIPANATTLPAGMPMQIPIYYRSFWGTPFQIIPDSHFVNGPLAVEFDTEEFVSRYPGWLKNYTEYAGGETRSGAGIIDLVAQNFSVSPRLLLALVEYHAGGLTKAILPEDLAAYPLGYESQFHNGLYLQLVWAANILNNGYYAWRAGALIEIERPDGTLERPDPWQNAATVGLQYYYNQIYSMAAYDEAIGPEGLSRTFYRLFDDPWASDQPHLPGSLAQPPLLLPFPAGSTWTHTGGPHAGWGDGMPFAALDFAPPSTVSGCFSTIHYATAMADGLVVRSEVGVVALDLDMDGDERTGWVIFYLHVATYERAEVGEVLQAGDPVGHPSCEGGTSTGTHIHIARKYNGEWMLADSPVAFVMEGWTPHNGDEVYGGTLTRFGRTVTACDCSNQASKITATGNYDGSGN